MSSDLGVSNSYLVIALFLIKSKPSHLSISGGLAPQRLRTLWLLVFLDAYQKVEYLTSLRKFITSGKRPCQAPSDRHVDAAAFWKNEFEKSEKEKTQLRNRIFVLEHQKGDILNAATNEVDQKTAGTKRKTLASNARAKKQKTGEASEEKCGQEVILERLAFEIPPSGCVYRTTLLRTYYLLQSLTPEAPLQSASVPHLAIEFVAAARHLISSIELSTLPAQNVDRHCTSGSIQAEVGQVQSISQTMEGNAALELEPFARLFTLVINRLQHIKILDDHTRQYTPCIMLAIFSLFKHLTEHITSLTRKSGALPPSFATTPKTKAFRRVNGRFAPRSKQHSPTQPPESTPSSGISKGPNPRDPNILALANLFIHMLSNAVGLEDRPELGLHWSHITESIFSLLITRVASFLSLMVFGASSPAELFAAPVQLPLLKASDDKRRAQEHEATWLLYLLEGSLPVMTSNSKLSAGDDNIRQPSPSGKKADRKSAVGPAKRKLQNTLLRALFGSSAPDFEDALKMKVDLDVPLDLPFPPVSPHEGHSITDGKDSVSEWFKSEVWRVVGWRLLRGWD